MKKNKSTISPESQVEAEKIAKKTQRPGQTKEQTRLISQGIAKGIAEYKKQHKARMRSLDKQRKQSNTAEKIVSHTEGEREVESSENRVSLGLLIWSILATLGCILATYAWLNNLTLGR